MLIDHDACCQFGTSVAASQGGLLRLFTSDKEERVPGATSLGQIPSPSVPSGVVTLDTLLLSKHERVHQNEHKSRLPGC